MRERDTEFIKCPRCGGSLELDTFVEGGEIREGILSCAACPLEFPIIDEIPIVWDDAAEYFACRGALGGRLYRTVQSPKMRMFVKKTLSSAAASARAPAAKGAVVTYDRTNLENRWSQIYHRSGGSEFYHVIKERLARLPSGRRALEHGCSVGTISNHLASPDSGHAYDTVVGIDSSYDAIAQAKGAGTDACYAVGDSTSCITGGLRFDLVVALNVLELIDPIDLIRHMSGQTPQGASVVMADPYDFERGSGPTPRRIINEHSLRAALAEHGFEISADTAEPSYIPWRLEINPRTVLNYKVDLVIGART